MEKLKTVDIKGKAYVMVNERIRYFNENYLNGSIVTELVSMNDTKVYMKAVVTPDIATPERKFTGWSYEDETNGFINKTSYIENCETSAIGRALGFMGIGVDESIATADEVANAIKNQSKPEPKKEAVISPAEMLVEDAKDAKLKVNWHEYLTRYKVYGLRDLTKEQLDEIRKELGL